MRAPEFIFGPANLKCLPDIQTKQEWDVWSTAERLQQLEGAFLVVEIYSKPKERQDQQGNARTRQVCGYYEISLKSKFSF